jgi:hypothetical protein
MLGSKSIEEWEPRRGPADEPPTSSQRDPDRVAELERLAVLDPIAYGMAPRTRATAGGAWSTVEAVMYELRTDGLVALARPNCQQRLVDLSADQMREVIIRLDQLRPKYPAITDDLLLQLAELAA